MTFGLTKIAGILCVCALGISCSVPSVARPFSSENADEGLVTSDLDLATLKAASAALKVFKTRQKTPDDCYKVDVYRTNDGWRIAFIIKRMDATVISVGKDKICGQSFSYELDHKYAFKREIFNR